jgi:hypothetical protein
MPSKNVTLGYQLPAGEAYTDDLGCTIVWYPNKDEYRRALLGSLTYLGTWIAWERDINKRGQDAARAWKEANDLTMECWQMSCLEQVQADVAAIRQMMSLMNYCCDGTITYGPPTVVDPPFTPGTGDPPEYYGETPIEDWDEWREYACYNANAYVDMLIDTVKQFAEIAGTSAWALGFVAAGLALLSFTGIGLPISFALAAAVLFGLLDAGANDFDGAAEDLEDAREDITCAIILGTSLSDAVETAVGTGSAVWLLILSHVDYGSASSIIQSGGYGDEYLPAETSTDCNDCGVIPSGIYINSPLSGCYVSLDGGSNWQTIDSELVEIVYGHEYLFQAQVGAQDLQVTITDIDDNYANCAISGDTNLPTGNGLLWSGQKPDGSYWENGVVHTVPGGYPVNYSDIRFFRARQNVIGYGSAYYVTAVFTEV